MRISLSEEAQSDFDAAIDWYIDDGAFVAAEDFSNALDQALAILGHYRRWVNRPRTVCEC